MIRIHEPKKSSFVKERIDVGNKTIESEMANLAEGLKRNAATFSAIGDSNRQAILITLLQNYGGMRVGDIARSIGLSRPATSHHLKNLVEVGLVDSYSVGTKNYYHVVSSAETWLSVSRLALSAAELAEVAQRRSEEDVVRNGRLD